MYWLVFSFFLIIANFYSPVIASADVTDVSPKTDIKPMVTVGNCMGREMENLLEKLAVELATLSPKAQEWVQRTGPSIRVYCEDSILVVQVNTPENGGVLEQRIDVNEAVSLAMFRYVAVVISELLAAAEDDQIKGELVVLPPSQPLLTPQESKKIKEPPSKLKLNLAPIICVGGTPAWVSYGAAFGLDFHLFKRFVPALNLDFVWGRQEVSLGVIDAAMPSGAAMLLFDFPTKQMSLMAGLGFRLGLVYWIGTPTKTYQDTIGRRETKPWNGPFVITRLLFPIADNIDIGFTFEGGWITYRQNVLVLKKQEMSLEGPWLRTGFNFNVKIL